MASLPDKKQDTGQFDALHSDLLLGFPRLVKSLGGDSNALLGAVGLSRNPDGEVRPAATYPQLIHLLELASAELDCPDLGLRLASIQNGIAGFGPLGEVMRNAGTFGEALQLVAEHHYAHSLAARFRLRPRVNRDGLFVGQDLLVIGTPNKTQTLELVMLLGHLGAQEITGGRARVRRVYFRHQPISSPATYRRYFGCEVLFGQDEDGVEFDARDLAREIVAPDPASLRRVLASLDLNFTERSMPTHAMARGAVMHLLGAGECTNEDVARELNLHPRTLHRKLCSEGTSFQKIKDEVRRDVMLYYLLETDLEFTLISEKLGFAEQAVMTRTCRRWLSASPTEVRAQRTHH